MERGDRIPKRDAPSCLGQKTEETCLYSGLELKQEYPPKVKAMFEAVLELFSSGRELSTLKVSEITEKAGIGKGTAYEYFSTKEEIIVGAIEYETKRHFRIWLELIEDGQSFQEIIYRGLDMLEEAHKKYQGFAVLGKIMRDNTISESSILKEIKKRRGECKMKFLMTEKLTALAADSGVGKGCNPYKLWSAILSQFISYAFYLSNQKLLGSMLSREEARDFAYQSVLKILDETDQNGKLTCAKESG